MEFSVLRFLCKNCYLSLKGIILATQKDFTLQRKQELVWINENREITLSNFLHFMLLTNTLHRSVFFNCDYLISFYVFNDWNFALYKIWYLTKIYFIKIKWNFWNLFTIKICLSKSWNNCLLHQYSSTFFTIKSSKYFKRLKQLN